MIRKFKTADIEPVMQIWLNGNIDAHPFVSKDYWVSNYDMVQELISQAEVFVYEIDEEIQGFIGIMDGFIAGLFVDSKYRSTGIGKQLLEHVKKRYKSLSLGVYQQNKRAVDFYFRENFYVSEEGVDEETGNAEYIMTWEDVLARKSQSSYNKINLHDRR